MNQPKESANAPPAIVDDRCVYGQVEDEDFLAEERAYNRFCNLVLAIFVAIVLIGLAIAAIIKYT